MDELTLRSAVQHLMDFYPTDSSAQKDEQAKQSLQPPGPSIVHYAALASNLGTITEPALAAVPCFELAARLVDREAH
jgi:hypothetical protein